MLPTGCSFRGIVPYNSPTSFSAPASSLRHTSGGMDSFLRNTAGSQNFGTSSGGLTPYYSPTWTVTTTQPGGRRCGYDRRFGDQFIRRHKFAERSDGILPKRDTILKLTRRPLSMSQQDLEKLVESDVTQYPQGGEYGFAVAEPVLARVGRKYSAKR